MSDPVDPPAWNAVKPASGVREGYPAVEPGHALWDAQQAGWPDHLPHEAWSAVVAAAPVAGFVSSAWHPAFDDAYIANARAERPRDVPAAPATKRDDKERR